MICYKVLKTTTSQICSPVQVSDNKSKKKLIYQWLFMYLILRHAFLLLHLYDRSLILLLQVF